MIPRVMGKPQQTDQGVVLHAYVQELEWFIYFLVQLPCRVQVLDPPEARAALPHVANKVMAMVAT